MPLPPLTSQLHFIVEIDKLKSVLRQTSLIHEARHENSAEHSWHLAMMALVLAEYAPEPVDLLHLVKMLLVHDLVEIEAGDTFCFDAQANLDKAAREQLAAAQLFGLLPEEQGVTLRALWDEFEAQQSVEARVADALDRLQPLLQNYHSQGHTWRQHRITLAQVQARIAPIQAGLPTLWPEVQRMIEEVRAAGLLGSE